MDKGVADVFLQCALACCACSAMRNGKLCFVFLNAANFQLAARLMFFGKGRNGLVNKGETVFPRVIAGLNVDFHVGLEGGLPAEAFFTTLEFAGIRKRPGVDTEMGLEVGSLAESLPATPIIA